MACTPPAPTDPPVVSFPALTITSSSGTLLTSTGGIWAYPTNTLAAALSFTIHDDMPDDERDAVLQVQFGYQRPDCSFQVGGFYDYTCATHSRGDFGGTGGFNIGPPLQPGLYTLWITAVIHFRLNVNTVYDWTQVAAIKVVRPLVCEERKSQTRRLVSETAQTLDPIATSTGNYRYLRSDLAIPGRGPSPMFKRAYNSVDDGVTSLGAGWTHNFATRVRCPGDETDNLYFVRDTGQTDLYTANLDGTYSPPPGVQATLVASIPTASLLESLDPSPGPSYTLTKFDQTVY